MENNNLGQGSDEGGSMVGPILFGLGILGALAYFLTREHEPAFAEGPGKRGLDDDPEDEYDADDGPEEDEEDGEEGPEEEEYEEESEEEPEEEPEEEEEGEKE